MCYQLLKNILLVIENYIVSYLKLYLKGILLVKKSISIDKALFYTNIYNIYYN